LRDSSPRQPEEAIAQEKFRIPQIALVVAMDIPFRGSGQDGRLCLGAFVLGLGAVLIALLFRPGRSGIAFRVQN
jgi:hypothetical protein